MNYDFSNTLLAPKPVRRKVFISHYHSHQTETDRLLSDFGDVFIRKTVGALGDENYINSTNPEYVMQRIRAEYIGDSTVTIVLVGKCTHSRRYVDWEIKGSLRQGTDSLPNGLIGIQMPSCCANSNHLRDCSPTGNRLIPYISHATSTIRNRTRNSEGGPKLHILREQPEPNVSGTLTRPYLRGI